MSIPSTYTHADKLGADGRAALAGARLVWDGLTKHMQMALTDAREGWRTDLVARAHNSTIEALVRRGLCVNHYGKVTVLGRLVREAGTRTPTSAGES